MIVTEPQLRADLDSWPANHVSAGWQGPGQESSTIYGDVARPFALASLTKPLFALAILVAVEEGSLSLDHPIDVGPQTGSDRVVRLVTVRQLLSHASGLAPVFDGPHTAPETRRIYSNLGFEVLGTLLEQATDMTAASYFDEAVCAPLGMKATRLEGSPAYAARSTLNDLLAFCGELMNPQLISPQTLADALAPQFADLAGVLPGYGKQTPNSWGLGFEIKGTKAPHWTGPSQSQSTVGHFGQAGTFFWFDPTTRTSCVVLTDLAFGDWAVSRWSSFNEQLHALLCY